MWRMGLSLNPNILRFGLKGFGVGDGISHTLFFGGEESADEIACATAGANNGGYEFPLANPVLEELVSLRSGHKVLASGFVMSELSVRGGDRDIPIAEEAREFRVVEQSHGGFH